MHASVAFGLVAGLTVWTATLPTQGRELANVRGSVNGTFYDLAVASVDVTQTAATPLFREVAVLCVVENLGPGAAPARAEVVISRPGEDSPKILRRVTIPESLAQGARFEVRAKNNLWHAASVPYRCELRFPASLAAHDANPTDDAKELVFPKL